jgi:hypothetical protein
MIRGVLDNHVFEKDRVSYFYQAYTLRLRSSFPLLELLPTPPTDPVDVDVSTVPEAYPGLEMLQPVQIVPEGVVYRLYPVGVVFVRQDHEIVLQTIPESDPAQVSDLIVNHAMALILHQRGQFVLHASAVAVDGGAVAFAGASGLGKSTTAAVFDQQGYRMLSDDIVAINAQPAHPVVFPAFPQVKLLPDAVASLYGVSDALPLHAQDGGKRVFRRDTVFPQTPLPLKAIYLLDRGDHTYIEPVPARQALIELFPHSYIARQVRLYGVDLLKGTHTEAAHFTNSARIASRVPIRRLRRSFAPGELAALPELICADLETL